MRKLIQALAISVSLAGVAAAPAAAGQASAAWSSTGTGATKLVHATRLGAVPASKVLSVAVGLRVRRAAALAAFTKAVDTPGNAQFHHYLTPSEFAADYAPTTAQVRSVTRYLESHGFTGVSVSGNRLFVTAQATAGQAEKAFHTGLSRYQQSGRVVYANSSPAQVPASLSRVVLSVLGLNDASTFKPGLSLKSLPAGLNLKSLPGVGSLTGSLPTGPIPTGSLPVTTTVSTNCELDPTDGQPYGLCDYTPQGFRTAYDAGSLTGAKTTIAIMAEGDLSGVVKDLRTAEKAFGEPAVAYTIVPVGVASNDTSGADEWDLDTQYSTGIANQVKRLYIYDTTSLTDEDIGLEFNKWASQDVAKAGSASFGECEALPYADGLMVTNDEVMNEAAAQGQTMHASSGDTGGQSCAVAPTNGAPESGGPAVNYPCSSPYIVCVGGTSLFTNPGGSYDTELGWVAGGGGISYLEYSPYWQSCVAPSNAGENQARGVPDIAMDADENTGADVYVDGSPEAVGGTSLSSPLALGSWAIIESSAGNRLGFASPLLYSLYPSAGNCQSGVPTPPTGPLGSATSDPSYPLHDVYLGSNGPYSATFGWDYVTGLGSYDIAKAAAALDKAAGS